MGPLAINGEVVSEAMRVDELPRGRREEGASIAGLEVWQPRNRGSLVSLKSWKAIQYTCSIFFLDKL